MGWSNPNGGWSNAGRGWYGGPAGGGSPRSYSYKGNSGSLSGASPSFSIDIGSAAADRLVIAGCIGNTNALTISSASAAGVALTQDIFSNGGGSLYLTAIYSGLVTSGSGAQTITFNLSGSDSEVVIHVWTANGLTSNTVKNTSTYVGNGNSTIPTSAGDFLFALAKGSSFVPDFSGSTEAPSAQRGAGSFNVYYSGDWAVAANHSPFSVVNTHTEGNILAATYA